MMGKCTVHSGQALVFIKINKLCFFSVVIPVYNKEKEIRSTLETVLVQSFIDFEVVLVDDGSSDGSMEIVKE